MNLSRRIVVAVLATVIVLFSGMLFWPFILNDLIRPTALVIWLLLRILVLSIDQQYFWGALVFVALILLLRLLPRGEEDAAQTDFPEKNAMLKNIEYWHALFTFNGVDVREERNLKRELIHLLTSLYESRQPASTQFLVYESLQKGEIPLPERIHAFLFAEESRPSGWSIKKYFLSISESIRQLIRHWTGQQESEHRQMIDEVLRFMEKSLEIKNDE
jgi:hypothetical protein